eukprot:scaffold2262_cov262-Pinguiococcus_pyrenoidosus.AAC.4
MMPNLYCGESRIEPTVHEPFVDKLLQLPLAQERVDEVKPGESVNTNFAEPHGGLRNDDVRTLLAAPALPTGIPGASGTGHLCRCTRWCAERVKRPRGCQRSDTPGHTWDTPSRLCVRLPGCGPGQREHGESTL